MANVIIRNYSTFFDRRTNVQFDPILEKSTGRYIGLATVTGEQASYFGQNPAYEVISDAQLSVITTGKLPAFAVDTAKVKADIATLSTDVTASASK